MFRNCRNLIRTLPAIPRDAKKPEDLNTAAEDHALDALRYLLMGRGGQGFAFAEAWQQMAAEVPDRPASAGVDRPPQFLKPGGS